VYLSNTEELTLYEVDLNEASPSEMYDFAQILYFSFSGEANLSAVHSVLSQTAHDVRTWTCEQFTIPFVVTIVIECDNLYGFYVRPNQSFALWPF